MFFGFCDTFVVFFGAGRDRLEPRHHAHQLYYTHVYTCYIIYLYILHRVIHFFWLVNFYFCISDDLMIWFLTLYFWYCNMVVGGSCSAVSSRCVRMTTRTWRWPQTPRVSPSMLVNTSRSGTTFQAANPSCAILAFQTCQCLKGFCKIVLWCAATGAHSMVLRLLWDIATDFHHLPVLCSGDWSVFSEMDWWIDWLIVQIDWLRVMYVKENTAVCPAHCARSVRQLKHSSLETKTFRFGAVSIRFILLRFIGC